MKPCKKTPDHQKTTVVITHVTPVHGNICLDLGFPMDDALALKVQSGAQIQGNVMRQPKGNTSDPRGTGVHGEESAADGEVPV
jgi:hypothetical protein